MTNYFSFFIELPFDASDSDLSEGILIIEKKII